MEEGECVGERDGSGDAEGEEEGVIAAQEDEVAEMVRLADGALEAACNGKNLCTTVPEDEEDSWPAEEV